MAKRKTPKSKKVVDLKPKAEKITEEQLTEIRGLVRQIDGIHNEIGKIEATKHQFLHRLAGINDEVKIVQGKLVDEYGNVDIDISTGAIKENEQVNP